MCDPVTMANLTGTAAALYSTNANAPTTNPAMQRQPPQADYQELPPRGIQAPPSGNMYFTPAEQPIVQPTQAVGYQQPVTRALPVAPTNPTPARSAAPGQVRRAKSAAPQQVRQAKRPGPAPVKKARKDTGRRSLIGR